MASLTAIHRTVLCCLAVVATCACQQTATPETKTQTAKSDSVQELESEIKELRALLADVRAETEQYRHEVRDLQRELREAASAKTPESQPSGSYPQPAIAAAPSSAITPPPPEKETTAQPAEDRIAKLEEEFAVLAGKVDDQYQTKVESASKYRVRFSGLVLLNLFDDRGGVNSIDVPGYAESMDASNESGSLGATLRQSQIGMEVFGPTWAGAHMTGDLHFDFAGGFQTPTTA